MSYEFVDWLFAQSAVGGYSMTTVQQLTDSSKMESKSFNTTKKTAFEVCKRTLTDFECEIVSADFSSGTIEAKRGGGLLSYGHNISVVVKTGDNGKIKISVSSNSVGVQIIDWGTNSENENELIELISNSFG